MCKIDFSLLMLFHFKILQFFNLQPKRRHKRVFPPFQVLEEEGRLNNSSCAVWNGINRKTQLDGGFLSLSALMHSKQFKKTNKHCILIISISISSSVHKLGVKC